MKCILRDAFKVQSTTSLLVQTTEVNFSSSNRHNLQKINSIKSQRSQLSSERKRSVSIENQDYIFIWKTLQGILYLIRNSVVLLLLSCFCGYKSDGSQQHTLRQTIRNQKIQTSKRHQHLSAFSRPIHSQALLGAPIGASIGLVPVLPSEWS